jgi:hypothetical protein
MRKKVTYTVVNKSHTTGDVYSDGRRVILSIYSSMSTCTPPHMLPFFAVDYLLFPCYPKSTDRPLYAGDTCAGPTIWRTYTQRTALSTYLAVACALPAELRVLFAQDQQRSCALQPCILSLWMVKRF